MDCSVTLVVNLHQEKQICIPSIKAASDAVNYANNAGIRSELLIILDNSDQETIKAATKFKSIARIVETNERDLGRSRNFAVSISKGQYIGFIDGDDLCSCNWITQAITELKKNYGKYIIHPHLNFYFGDYIKGYFIVQPDMREDNVSIFRLLAENIWTSPIITDRNILVDFPYKSNDVEVGIGYEDWSFNIKTYVAGIFHITASNTIICVRKHVEDSLSRSQYRKNAAPNVHDMRHLLRMA